HLPLVLHPAGHAEAEVDRIGAPGDGWPGFPVLRDAWTAVPLRLRALGAPRRHGRGLAVLPLRVPARMARTGSCQHDRAAALVPTGQGRADHADLPRQRDAAVA